MQFRSVSVAFASVARRLSFFKERSINCCWFGCACRGGIHGGRQSPPVDAPVFDRSIEGAASSLLGVAAGWTGSVLVCLLGLEAPDESKHRSRRRRSIFVPPRSNVPRRRLIQLAAGRPRPPARPPPPADTIGHGGGFGRCRRRRVGWGRACGRQQAGSRGSPIQHLPPLLPTVQFLAAASSSQAVRRATAAPSLDRDRVATEVRPGPPASCAPHAPSPCPARSTDGRRLAPRSSQQAPAPADTSN